MEGLEDRLDGALRAEDLALGDPAQPPALVGHRRAGWEVDVGYLEQRNVVVAGIDVVAGSTHETDRERRAQQPLLRRQRHRQLDRVRIRVGRLERVRVGLVVARPDEHVLHETAQALEVRQPAEHRLPRRQGRRHVLEPEAADLLDQVDVTTHVAGAPRRRRHRPVLRHLEPEALETVALLRLGDLQSEHGVRVGGYVGHDRARRQLAAHLGLTRPARARQLDQELRRVGGRRPGELRVDALLPARLTLGAHALALAAAQNGQRLEVGRLEHDARRCVRDLGVAAAHDAADRDRLLGVRDHEVIGIE